MLESASEVRGPQGLRLRGLLCLPEGPGPHPAVACFHGLTLTHSVFETVAPVLADAGVASLRLNFRGHGDSEGRLDEQGFEDQVGDVLAGFEALKDQPGVDPKRLGILGFSMGAAACACAANRLGERAKALGLWAPLLKTLAWKDNRFGTYGRPSAGKVEIWDKVIVSERLFSEAVALDPYGQAVAYSGPALFVHGSKDKNHPQLRSQEAVADRLMEGKETWHAFLPASGHHYHDPAERAWRDRLTAQFFAAFL